MDIQAFDWAMQNFKAYAVICIKKAVICTISTSLLSGIELTLMIVA